MLGRHQSGVRAESREHQPRREPSTSDVPAQVNLQLTLRDVHELSRLIRHIEKVPGVEHVQRTMG